MHPQTIAVLKSRADGLGLTVEVGDESKFQVDKDVSGVLVQYPATDGSVHDYKVGLTRPSLLSNQILLMCSSYTQQTHIGTEPFQHGGV